jgi:hypothetical protein
MDGMRAIRQSAFGPAGIPRPEKVPDRWRGPGPARSTGAAALR